MLTSRRFWARAAFTLLLVVVTFLTVTPNPEDIESGMKLTRWLAALLLGDASYDDKVAHFLAYGALGFAAFWARLAQPGRRRWAVLALAVYGALLEGMQALVAARSPEFGDAVANAAGAIAGFVGAHFIAAFGARTTP